jgi:hypothetical protein
VYDSTIGQFLTEDPIGFRGGDENIRRYVANDPLNATDPDGLKAKHINDVRQRRGESDEAFKARYAEQQARQDDFDWRLRAIAMSDNDTLAACLARQALAEKTTLRIVWTTNAPTHASRGGEPDEKGKPGKERTDLTIYLDPRGDDYLDPAVDRGRVDLDGVFPESAAMIVIAHELGHAMLDLTDPTPTNPGGGNVTLCENEFRRVLGVKPRRTYEGTPVPRRSQVNPGERDRAKALEDEEYGLGLVHPIEPSRAPTELPELPPYESPPGLFEHP